MFWANPLSFCLPTLQLSLCFSGCISKFRVESMTQHFRPAFSTMSVLDLCLCYWFFLLLGSQSPHTALWEDFRAMAMTGSPRPYCYPLSFLPLGYTFICFLDFSPSCSEAVDISSAAISLGPGLVPGTEQVHTLWMNEWNEWINGWFASIWQNNALIFMTMKLAQKNYTKQRLTWIIHLNPKPYLDRVYFKGLQFRKCPCWYCNYFLALTVQCREFVCKIVVLSQVVSLTIILFALLAI